jgi:hypothetical protein
MKLLITLMAGRRPARSRDGCRQGRRTCAIVPQACTLEGAAL